MKLGFNLDFDSLSSLAGLTVLDDVFLQFLNDHDQDLYKSLQLYRANSIEIKDKEYSNFLTCISPLVDDFLVELFGIENDVEALRREAAKFDIIYECKRKFVQRFAVKKYPKDKLPEIDFKSISASLKELFGDNLTEESLAKGTLQWLKEPEVYAEALDIAARYAAYMVHNNSNSMLFNLPEIIDKDNLITFEKIEKHKSTVRYGFNYFAPELNSENALNHAHYCIYCHNQQKDSCRKGLKLPQDEVTNNSKSGCPLRQKISEMNYVKVRGFYLATLAIIVIDNPMVVATGHRICNDCMNSCIFQKQEPVNIPLIESNILDSVLKLPYGLEIYLLLTRWNPLNIYSPLPQVSTNYNILIAGLGPAGFSLAHYLLNEGHNVVAIEGLKISPLPFDFKLPIKYWEDFKQSLSLKVPQGFGGVAEYGITARWDKNNLTILRLILERRNNFKIYSGVRLGSNILNTQAFELGFDHIALCTGAGQPKLPKLANSLAKGVRTSSDFLMTLQNGGAYLNDSLTNLTLRLPVAIIGCGLTAVDCAVEAFNYYPIQVEKFLKQYEDLVAKWGLIYTEQKWSTEDRLIAEGFIEHAKLFRQQGSEEKIRQIIIEQLGGVTIYYRGDLKNSHGYKLNPEEILHAQAAGVKFMDNMSPSKINVDNFDYAQSIDFGSQTISARTILMAIGTEQSGIEFSNNKFSYFGDCNPNYAGSVVKALASSKEGYKKISDNLSGQLPNFSGAWQKLVSKMDDLLISKIEKVNILSDNIVELIIYSPQAVKNFQPGQFFRLQNYSNDTQKLIEPLALTGAYIEPQHNLISLIILEVGKSSNLCRQLRRGEEVVLMGPTGEPTEILSNANIILVGGGLGNVVLFSIGKALKLNGCHVNYIAGYRQSKDRFYAHKIEEAADIVMWCCEEELMQRNRAQDISLKGTVIDGLKTYVVSKHSRPKRIICIGSDLMMAAVKNIKNDLFPPQTSLICSISSPMQCMMKGICGQCVQQTLGNLGYIFTCTCQDQDAEFIDFKNLKSRLEQNSLQEKLRALI